MEGGREEGNEGREGEVVKAGGREGARKQKQTRRYLLSKGVQSLLEKVLVHRPGHQGPVCGREGGNERGTEEQRVSKEPKRCIFPKEHPPLPDHGILRPNPFHVLLALLPHHTREERAQGGVQVR